MSKAELHKYGHTKLQLLFSLLAWNLPIPKTLTEAFCSLTAVQWKLLIAVGGLSAANGSMELWDTSNNIIREIEYVNDNDQIDTSQVSKEAKTD